MSPEDTQPKKKARWPRRVARTTLVLLALAAAYGAYRWYWIAEVRARHAAIRAEGYPVTYEELDAWYEEPAFGQNAASLYIRAFSLYIKIAEEEKVRFPIVGDGEVPKGRAVLADEIKKLILAHLAANEETLELLHKASAVSRCRYPGTLAPGSIGAIHHAGNAADLTELLILDVLIRAEEGRPDAAVRSLVSAMRIGRSLKDYPAILPTLLRILCDARAVQALERVMTVSRLGDAQLVRLADVFEQGRADNGLARALAGDRCRGIRAFQDPKFMWADMDGEYRWRPWHWVYQAGGLMEQDHVFFLDTSSKWIRAARLPLPERIEALKVLDEQIQRSEGKRRRKRLVSGLQSPLFRKVCVQDAWSVGKTRAARTGIAAERFRLRTGKLPEKLAQLAPEFVSSVPSDPFDGKPLRFKRLDEGYVLYSVGENGEDDGGSNEEDEHGRQRSDDVTFTIRR